MPARGAAPLDRPVGSRPSGPQSREPGVEPRSFAGNRLALPERAIVSPRPSGPATPRRTARMTNAENEFRSAQALLGNHRYADAVAGFERVLQMIDDGAVRKDKRLLFVTDPDLLADAGATPAEPQHALRRT